MDKDDKFFAVIITFMIVLLGAFFAVAYISILFAAPVLTILGTVLAWIAVKRVYPKVLEWME